MKKFKNIESFEKASQYLQQNYYCPIFDCDGNLTEAYRELDAHDFADVIYNTVQLLDSAKNAAVRAAIHQVLIGNATIDYREEEDGEPYYSEDEYGNINYLGRGVLTIASFRPANGGSYLDYTIGSCVIEHRTPLD
jgi:methionyl-tRNA formyltransferase